MVRIIRSLDFASSIYKKTNCNNKNDAREPNRVTASQLISHLIAAYKKEWRSRRARAYADLSGGG